MSEPSGEITRGKRAQAVVDGVTELDAATPENPGTESPDYDPPIE